MRNNSKYVVVQARMCGNARVSIKDTLQFAQECSEEDEGNTWLVCKILRVVGQKVTPVVVDPDEIDEQFNFLP